jgi:hypothetical protein
MKVTRGSMMRGGRGGFADLAPVLAIFAQS